MNTITHHSTMTGADDNNSPALNYSDLLIEDFRLNKRARMDALTEAVFQAPSRTTITTSDVAAAHRYMLHLLDTQPSEYVDLTDGIVNSVRLASDALSITRQPPLSS